MIMSSHLGVEGERQISDGPIPFEGLLKRLSPGGGEKSKTVVMRLFFTEHLRTLGLTDLKR